jgi:hypothetical protein
MSVMLTRVFLAAPLTSSCAVAQEPTGSQDATIQALLKGVHALRIALERTNEIGPKNQIAYPSIIRPFDRLPFLGSSTQRSISTPNQLPLPVSEGS